MNVRDSAVRDSAVGIRGFSPFSFAQENAFLQSVLDKNRLQSNCKAFHNACSDKECAEKAALSCTHIFKCGHLCRGVKDEKPHLPCLEPECLEKGPEDVGGWFGFFGSGKQRKALNITQETEDLCNICYTEDLGQAPCIALPCSHVFHFGCVMERVKAQWNSARIDFRCARVFWIEVQYI